MIKSSFLLKDSITVISKVFTNGEEAPTSEEVTNVRVEPTTRMTTAQGVDGLVVGKFIVWVDLEKSNYSSVDIFNEGNTVIFNDVDYNISQVFPVPQRNGKTSHLEVLLV